MESSQSLRRRATAALRSVLAHACAVLLALCAAPAAPSAAAAEAAAATDAAAGTRALEPSSRDEFARIVAGEIRAKRLPGAVIVAGDAKETLYREAFGARALTPSAEPMTIDTVFDLASLTKVIATTTAIMQLVEAHRLELDAPVARYWPAFAAHGKQAVTIRQLLTHTSGFAPDLPLRADARDRQGVLRELVNEPLRAAPGARTVYSDINFLALGALVERVTHRPLDVYCRTHIFAPLGMRDTLFEPDSARTLRAAPTTADERGMRTGRVHDPSASRMGGVAGNAGLFATADDLARFARMMLNGGRLGNARVLSRESIAALAAPAAPASPPDEAQWRGLGWALEAPLVANRFRLPPAGLLYHTGYTGTAIYIDLVTRKFLIILTNRVHPDDSGDARPLRAQTLAWFASAAPAASLAEIVHAVPASASAVAHATQPGIATGSVMTGIDVLESAEFAPLRGMRVGLVTNRTGFDRAGNRTIDVLAHAGGVTLSVLFSPEHGLDIDLDERVPDSTDARTGLPVFSLYGAQRRFPARALAGLDALVFDLQDAGVRFFTYETTLGYALEAAAAHHIPLFVLDRPDPLGADRFGGPMSDPGHESFTGYFPLPLLPGLTVGELSALLNDERAIGADLRVIPMEGYRRSMRTTDTGLAWMPLSPNLRTPAQLARYPELGLIEGANVSVGRGTPHPFEWFGAPWIDGVRLAAALNALALGTQFTPVDFVPTESAFSGQQCHGVSLAGDPYALPPGELGVALIATLHALYPDRFALDATRDALGSQSLWAQLARAGAADSQGTAGIRATLDVLDAQIAESTRRFASMRSQYLRY